MKTALIWFGHFLVVLLVLIPFAAGIALWAGADFYYGDNLEEWAVGDEGPHVFQRGEAWQVRVIRGNCDDGFRVEEKYHPLGERFPLDVSVPLDNSHFRLQAGGEFVTPPTRYQDDAPLLAVSEIEGNFRAFRDFLLKAGVIDTELNWIFGKGHLVLVGDFVDRGPSVTQVLWLIYKLEQDAGAQGGRVHYLLGNHEIKNLQGNFQSAHDRYTQAAAVLGLTQPELFGESSFLGRWLMSKNTAEVINGVLFVHGGLHPQLAELPYTLEDINRIVRGQYRQVWYPRAGAGSEDLLLHPKTGPAWYRGYFREDLHTAQVTQTLAKFSARAVVVGHTLQSQVHALFDNSVYAIDVRHPWDHRTGVPPRRSEGLWLEGGKFSRMREDGSREAL